MSPTLRALRVGVLLGDKLVEERVFRSTKLAPITFGQSLRCTLSVPADGVPANHVLFGVDQGRLVLRVTAQMSGRLAQGNRVDNELRQGPGDNGIWTIPLERGARGKLHVGSATILFQEIAVPPLAPRPQLPASVRGSLVDRVDRRLAVIVAGSLMFHLGVAGWAWMQDREKVAGSEGDVAQYDAPKYDVIDVTAPDEPLPVTSGEPGVAAPVKPAVQTPTNSSTPRPARPDRLPDPVDVDRWAQVLTGTQRGRDGQTEIPNRLPDSALDQQIRHIKEIGGEIKPGGRASRDPGLRIGDGPDGPHIGDPNLDQIAKQENKPITRITPIPMPRLQDQPTLTMNMVLARIQGSYMAGLQRCYVKHGLAHDATLVAKVTISFTVDDKGISTENQAHGATAEVDSCILDQMAGWKFPVPKDKDGDPTDAPFKLQLALQPS